MIRASAKNFPDVIVVVDPGDYPSILEKLKAGGVERDERKRLAQKAFQHVATYDTAISQYLRQGIGDFPEEMTIALKKRYSLRYGENPGQEAALYELVDGNLALGECKFIEPGSGLVSSITETEMLQAGKHPGKTNLTDLDNGLNILKYLYVTIPPSN